MKINQLSIKLLVFSCLFCLYTEGVVAQQESAMTLFMYNPWAVNPAAAGYRDLTSVVLYHRSQWLGFKGGPTFQTVSVNTPAFSSRRFGVAAGFTNRSAGLLAAQTGTLALSYSVLKIKDFSFRMGLQGSFRRFTTHFNDAPDIAILQADRSIPPRRSTNYYPNIGFGALATYDESYLGFSVPFYLPNTLGINAYTPVTAAESPHFYLMGGLSFQVAEGIVLKPQGMFKYVKYAPWNFEANLTSVFKDKISVGLSYRAGRTNIVGIGESASMTTLLQVNESMAIGGAYDWIFGSIGKFTYGSFEMLMRYDLKKKDIKMSNPRGF